MAAIKTFEKMMKKMKKIIFSIIACLCMITLCLQAHTIEFQEYTADTIPSVSRNSFQGAFNISVGDAALGRPAVMFSLVHNYCFSPDFAIETGIHFSSWSLFAEIVQPANMGITAWLSNQYLLDIASVWYPIPALPLRVGVGPALRWHSVILTASGSVSRMSQGISIGAVVKVEYDCGRIAGTSAAWGGAFANSRVCSSAVIRFS